MGGKGSPRRRWKAVFWVKPRLVANFEFLEWTVLQKCTDAQRRAFFRAFIGANAETLDGGRIRPYGDHPGRRKLPTRRWPHECGPATASVKQFSPLSSRALVLSSIEELTLTQKIKTPSLAEELIIDHEGSHVICRAELGPTQPSLRSHVRP
jgi:hypothetical protein